MPSKTVHKVKGWKHVQSKAKMQKKTKLALGVLAVVFGFIIISGTARLIQSLFISQKNYAWNGEFNINLVIKSKNISLFSYNPQDEKITIVNIPDETFLEVPSGFGKWQLRSIYELGQSQKGIGGNKLLADTLTSFFAVPVDGYLDFSTSNQFSASEIIDTLRKNPFSGFQLVSSLKTDITMWELIKLKLSIASVRFDKIKVLNLQELDILDKETLPDGSQVFTADPVKLDSVLTDLTDPAVFAEHKSIAVFNAADHPQLAGKWARLVINLGGNVIITSNADKKLKKTLLFGEDSQTLKRLKQIFSSSDRISAKEQELTSSRAQVNIYLGEDFIKK
ncbi:LCP family protein [Candidatus Daviesbacteria bacterium]|nr:LCP family protein [Candidatus Daviesbacteria bacterium]